ncbi:cytochrome b561 [Ophiostoma piceae UAMH 11346]|uniref:Cytochrome b561 n=1 Tax=Ophiostoma piceae (strain UAMH 11346) TaxID=1262450 RepID=S3BPL9_OPHP1|nr:cytochrome b561 [Ophiostoma piceae UAMH 11346]
MASATGIPAQVPVETAAAGQPDESSPLLGRPGDVLQKPGDGLVSNLYTGTAWLAQAGAILLVALVWTAVSQNTFLPLFSPHPLLQATGVFFVVQAILVLQPTAAPHDKVRGARVHAVLHLVSFLILFGGVAFIETNKFVNNGVHFHSLHGYLGVLTAVVLFAQYLFGLIVWWAPAFIFGAAADGGVDRAKALWKQHRWSGYVLLLPLVAVTVATATSTDYNVNVLDIRPWAVIVALVLIGVGVYPRIHTRKLGLGQ